MMQSAPANTVKSAAIWTGFARFQEEEGAEVDAALPEQHRFFSFTVPPPGKKRKHETDSKKHLSYLKTRRKFHKPEFLRVLT